MFAHETTFVWDQTAAYWILKAFPCVCTLTLDKSGPKSNTLPIDCWIIAQIFFLGQRIFSHFVYWTRLDFHPHRRRSESVCTTRECLFCENDSRSPVYIYTRRWSMQQTYGYFYSRVERGVVSRRRGKKQRGTRTRACVCAWPSEWVKKRKWRRIRLL